jgi:hypothetical protein
LIKFIVADGRLAKSIRRKKKKNYDAGHVDSDFTALSLAILALCHAVRQHVQTQIS